MLIRLLSVVILVPLAEILVLIESGRLIGVWPTVLLVVLTGIAAAPSGACCAGTNRGKLVTGRTDAEINPHGFCLTWQF